MCRLQLKLRFITSNRGQTWQQTQHNVSENPDYPSWQKSKTNTEKKSIFRPSLSLPLVLKRHQINKGSTAANSTTGRTTRTVTMWEKELERPPSSLFVLSFVTGRSVGVKRKLWKYALISLQEAIYSHQHVYNKWLFNNVIVQRTLNYCISQ